MLWHWVWQVCIRVKPPCILDLPSVGDLYPSRACFVVDVFVGVTSPLQAGAQRHPYVTSETLRPPRWVYSTRSMNNYGWLLRVSVVIYTEIHTLQACARIGHRGFDFLFVGPRTWWYIYWYAVPPPPPKKRMLVYYRLIQTHAAMEVALFGWQSFCMMEPLSSKSPEFLFCVAMNMFRCIVRRPWYC